MTSRRSLLAFSVALASTLCLPLDLAASEAQTRLVKARLSRENADEPPGLYLDATWDFVLPDGLLESLLRGIALHFRYEFRLEKKRWYWTNQTIAENHMSLRVSYSPLSRRFHLSEGGLTQSFSAISDIAPLIRRVSRWRIADMQLLEDIQGSRPMDAEIRLHLDTTKLPKPLQVSIGGKSDWIIDSDWISVSLPDHLD